MVSSDCKKQTKEQCLMEYFMELKAKAQLLDKIIDYISTDNVTVDGVKAILESDEYD